MEESTNGSDTSGKLTPIQIIGDLLSVQQPAGQAGEDLLEKEFLARLSWEEVVWPLRDGTLSFWPSPPPFASVLSPSKNPHYGARESYLADFNRGYSSDSYHSGDGSELEYDVYGDAKKCRSTVYNVILDDDEEGRNDVDEEEKQKMFDAYSSSLSNSSSEEELEVGSSYGYGSGLEDDTVVASMKKGDGGLAKDKATMSGKISESKQQKEGRQVSPKDTASGHAGGSVEWNEEFQRLCHPNREKHNKKHKQKEKEKDDNVEEGDDEYLKEMRRVFKLHRLTQHFAETAQRIGTEIIRELHAHPSEKKYPPINIGGRAGGEKFLYENIFFKFCFDLFGFYGGDDFAMKAARLEQQGIKSYFRFINESKAELHVPLMILVDYMGYRLVAVSVLPLGQETLVYGSNDGGEVVYTADPLMCNLMKEAAEFIGIKGHVVALIFHYALGLHVWHSPGDIEGHRGEDGRYYVLDTARVFPPFPTDDRFIVALLKNMPEESPQNDITPAPDFWEYPVDSLMVFRYEQDAPRTLLCKETAKFPVDVLDGFVIVDQARQHVPCPKELNMGASILLGRPIYGNALYIPPGIKGRRLVNCFRWEFVQEYGRAFNPLSSDAFTGFGRDRWHEHNKEVYIAEYHLIKNVIPSFLHKYGQGEIVINDGRQLTAALHSAGINVRMLGCLLDYPDSPQTLMETILMEMIMRAAKSVLRGVMRFYSASSEARMRNEVLLHLNYLLGTGPVSRLYFESIIKLVIRTKFNYEILPVHGTWNFITAQKRQSIFQNLQARLGISCRLDISFDQIVPLKFGDVTNLTSMVSTFEDTDFIDRSLERVTNRKAESLADGKMSRQARNSWDRHIWQLRLETLQAAEQEWLFGASGDRILANAVAIGYALYHLGNFEEARTKVLEAFDKFKMASIEIVISGRLLIGHIHEHLGQADEALNQYYATWLLSQRVWGTQSEEEADSRHWIPLFVLNRLVRLLYAMHRYVDITAYYSTYCTNLCKKFGPYETNEELKSVWGYPTPIPLAVADAAATWTVGPLTVPQMADMCDMPSLVCDLDEEKATKALSFIKQRTQLFLQQAEFLERLDKPSMFSQILVVPSLDPVPHPPAKPFIGGTFLSTATYEIVQGATKFITLEWSGPYGDMPEAVYLYPRTAYMDSPDWDLPAAACFFETDMQRNFGKAIASWPFRFTGEVVTDTNVKTSILVEIPPLEPGQYVFFVGKDELVSFQLKFDRLHLHVLSNIETPRLVVFPLRLDCERNSSPLVITDFGRKDDPRQMQDIISLTSYHCSYGQFGDDMILAATDLGELYIIGGQSATYATLHVSHLQESLWPRVVGALLGLKVSKVVMASENNLHILALCQGKVYSWGSNEYGQLGTGRRADRMVPGVVEALQSERVVDIAAGLCQSYALTADGQVYHWGASFSNDIESSVGVLYPTPIAGFEGGHIRTLAAGFSTLVALSELGIVHYYGAIHGVDDLSVKFSCLYPFVVEDLLPYFIIKVQAGDGFCMALSSEGRIFTWGDGATGVLGHGTVRSTLGTLPPSLKGHPHLVNKRKGVSEVYIPGQKRIADIDAHVTGCCCLTEDEEVWLWGMGVPLPQMFVPLKGNYPPGFLRRIFCSGGYLYVFLDGREEIRTQKRQYNGMLPCSERIEKKRHQWLTDYIPFSQRNVQH